MKVTFIPIIIGALGTVTKGLIKDWRTWKKEDEWRQSKLQQYWNQSEYCEESLRLEEATCHSNSRDKPSANADVKKNSQEINNNYKYVHERRPK